MSAMNDMMTDANHVMKDNQDMNRELLRLNRVCDQLASALADKSELIADLWLALGNSSGALFDPELMILQARLFRAVLEAVQAGDVERVNKLAGKG